MNFYAFFTTIALVTMGEEALGQSDSLLISKIWNTTDCLQTTERLKFVDTWFRKYYIFQVNKGFLEKNLGKPYHINYRKNGIELWGYVSSGVKTERGCNIYSIILFCISNKGIVLHGYLEICMVDNEDFYEEWQTIPPFSESFEGAINEPYPFKYYKNFKW